MDAVLGIIQNDALQKVFMFLFGLLVKYQPTLAEKIRNRWIPYLNTIIGTLALVVGAGVAQAQGLDSLATDAVRAHGFLPTLFDALTKAGWNAIQTALFYEFFTKPHAPRPAYSKS